MPSPPTPETQRKGAASSGHRRRTTLVFAIAGALLLGAGSWHVHLLQVGQASPTGDQLNQRFLDQVKRGLGSQVKFAVPGSPSDEVLASVESVDRFINDRAGLTMSDETKKRLAFAEEATLNGKLPKLNVEALTSILTETALERFTTVTDSEISYATRTLSFGKGSEVVLRANGDGHLLASDFVKYATYFRDQSRAGDNTVQYALQQPILQEVTGRLTLFGAAVPNQFGRAVNEGVTPLQALLIAYSLLSDDHLAGSQEDLNRQMAQMQRRDTQNDPYAMRAFGAYGRIFSTPINLILNRQTMAGFLNRVEGGRNQK